jgi:hypothetical protein
LTSKSKPDEIKPAISQHPGAGGNRQTPVNYDYNDFFRFDVSHSYDFENSNRSFSPILARLDITPGKYIRADAASGIPVGPSR